MIARIEVARLPDSHVTGIDTGADPLQSLNPPEELCKLSGLQSYRIFDKYVGSVPNFLQPAFQLLGAMNVIEGARRHFLLVVQHQTTHASRESRGEACYQVAASVLQEVQSSPQMD